MLMKTIDILVIVPLDMEPEPINQKGEQILSIHGACADLLFHLDKAPNKFVVLQNMSIFLGITILGKVLFFV